MQATYLKSASDRDILLRLQNNIKTRALEAEDTEHALEVLETMTLISPDTAALVSELAILEAEAGNFKQALGRLNSFLARRQGHPEEAQVMALMKNLKQSLQ
jgi:regulator of sirC expression with transglutaminase-like and TPR domain